MERLVTPEEVHQALFPVRREGKTIAVVPTMGALHDGHLSLVRAARERADYVVVSIFVNPTQFGPNEDFESYPRDVPGDIDKLDAEGVDSVFTPTPDAMYPPGTAATVEPGPLALLLEGKTRPTHFRGVCTVVAKLFNIVRPDLAFFGEKDFQQLVIVRHMVDDLNFSVRVVGCPIVREADGLALSSRNVYLSAEERVAATVLSRALGRAQALVDEGITDTDAVRVEMALTIEAEPLAEIDYAAVVDSATLEPLEHIGGETRALVAARIGTTRLIDNAPLVPARSETTNRN